jgi:hypothetical protein
MIENTFYKFRNNNFINSKIGGIIICIFIIAVIMFFPHFFRNTYTVTITNKQILRRNNINTYLIYGQKENGKIMVFKDVNSFVELKFNSEDLYMAMQVNRKYQVTAYGLSIPQLSHYQNIAKVKGLKVGVFFIR